MSVLFRYILRNFFGALIAVSAVIVLVVLLAESLEMLRKGAKAEAPVIAMLHMALLKLPQTLIIAAPFVILIASAVSAARMSSNRELVVLRTSGYSPMRVALPAVMLCTLIGVIYASSVPALQASMQNKYENMAEEYLGKPARKYGINDGQIWMLWEEDGLQGVFAHSSRLIFNAKLGVEADLADISIFAFGDDGGFITRLDAASAQLGSGHLTLEDVYLYRDGEITMRDKLEVDIDIDMSELMQNISPAQHTNLWEFAGVMRQARSLGVEVFGYVAQAASLAVTPIYFAAMAMLGALFCMNTGRFGRTSLRMLGAVVAGFMIFLMGKLVQTVSSALGAAPILSTTVVPVSLLLFTSAMLLRQRR